MGSQDDHRELQRSGRAHRRRRQRYLQERGTDETRRERRISQIHHDSDTKLLPLMFSVTLPLPAITELGEVDVICGVGLVVGLMNERQRIRFTAARRWRNNNDVWLCRDSG